MPEIVHIHELGCCVHAYRHTIFHCVCVAAAEGEGGDPDNEVFGHGFFERKHTLR
jgi:hypothetical protein